MKSVTWVVVGLLALSGVAYAAESSKGAKAELVNSQGQSIGKATLTEVPNGVKIALEVSHLPPGIHALHIHAVGKCDPPDFKTAGGHFNPEGKKHGKKNPKGAHAGDLPNIVVGKDGTSRMVVIAQGVTLADGKNSLFQPEGTSIVIHAAGDDEMTDPAGNAGARIACGVIQKD